MIKSWNNKKSWNYQFTDLPNHQTICNLINITLCVYCIHQTIILLVILMLHCHLFKKLKYNNIESIYIIIHYYFNNIHIMCILCGNVKTMKLGIKNLDCSICPSITSIPHIEGLQKLNCSNCPSITSIPHILGCVEYL